MPPQVPSFPFSHLKNTSIEVHTTPNLVHSLASSNRKEPSQQPAYLWPYDISAL